ncbi:MAG: hypothetical protein WBM54_09445, partial [Woeseia sp.]
MAIEGQFSIITEAAVALAGFAGVVASFQFSGDSYVARGNILALSMMVVMSLNVALFSLVPFVFFEFGLDDATVWRLCSFLFGMTWPIAMYSIYQEIRKIQVRRRSSLYTFLGLGTISCVTAIALFLSAAGIVLPPGPGVFYASLVLALSISGYMFVRLVVRPLWREVRVREAAE